MKTFCAALAVVLLSSCSGSLEQEVAQTFDSGEPKVVHEVEIGFFGDSTRVSTTEYYQSGQVRMIGNLNEAEEREGSWESFYEDGSRWSEGFFANGVRTGTGTVYYRNGQKKMEGEYFEGKEHGTWTFWFNNGRKQKELVFDHGVQHGPMTEWHTNTSHLKTTGTYEQGKPVGQWSYYYPNGQLREQVDKDK